jgi:hypothetical protein
MSYFVAVSSEVPCPLLKLSSFSLRKAVFASVFHTQTTIFLTLITAVDHSVLEVYRNKLLGWWWSSSSSSSSCKWSKLMIVPSVDLAKFQSSSYYSVAWWQILKNYTFQKGCERGFHIIYGFIYLCYWHLLSGNGFAYRYTLSSGRGWMIFLLYEQFGDVHCRDMLLGTYAINPQLGSCINIVYLVTLSSLFLNTLEHFFFGGGVFYILCLHEFEHLFFLTFLSDVIQGLVCPLVAQE